MEEQDADRGDTPQSIQSLEVSLGSQERSIGLAGSHRHQRSFSVSFASALLLLPAMRRRGYTLSSFNFLDSFKGWEASFSADTTI